MHGMKNVKRRTVDQNRNNTFNETLERFSGLYKMNGNIRYDNPPL